MEIKVKSLYLKSSPQKVRLILFGLRGKIAQEAYTALSFTNKKGAKLIASLLKSAIAIGKENDLEIEKLYIKSVSCTEGPRLKRRQIKARGRSDAITKRMSHLNLVLSDTALDTSKENKQSNINRGKSEIRNPKSETNSKS